MLYAVGVGPLHSEVGRQHTRMAFEQCQCATVRDAESLALLHEIDAQDVSRLPGVQVTADPVFNMPYASQAEVDSVLQSVGVTRALSLCGVSVRYWDLQVGPEWELEVARALDAFLDRTPGQIVFLPFQQEQTSRYDDDLAVIRRVRNGLKHKARAIILEREIRPELMAGVLSACDTVLAMRYHAVLFALNAAVPVVNLAYDPKTTALMRRAGLEHLSLPGEDWQADAILEGLHIAKQEQMRNKLLDFRDEMRILARDNARLAVQLLSSKAVSKYSSSERFVREFALDRALRVTELEDQLAERERAVGELRPQVEKQEQVVAGLQARMVERDEPQVIRDPNRHENTVTRRHRAIRGLFFVLSGVPIDDTGGGARCTQIALELLHQGFAVVFINKFPKYESIELGLETQHPNLFTHPLSTFEWERFCREHNGLFTGDLLAAIVEFPLADFIPLITNIRELGGVIVYDLLDDWTTSLGSHWYSPAIEEEIIVLSDVLVATAPTLAARLEQMSGRPVALLPNAVNDRVFDPSRRYPRPDDLPDAEWTLIYVGALWGEWFDWDLLVRAAERYPTAAVVVIGDYRGQCQESPSNLHFLGLKPQTEIPAYLAHSDVAVIPWKVNAITQATSPLKVYEYLAIRRPVVAPNIDTLVGIPGVFLADDSAEFIEKISELRQTTLSDEAISRFLIHNTWKARVNSLVELVLEYSHRDQERTGVIEVPSDPTSLAENTTYQERVRSEIQHYAAEYQDEESRRTLTQKVPPSWFFIEDKAQNLIRQANEGRNFVEEVVAHMQAHPGGRALSIGSGPGGVELEIARRLGDTEYEIICLDISPQLVELGRERANSEELNVKFEVQDCNELALETDQYDVIMCHASLHHLINLEHVLYEMNCALKNSGEIVINDVVTRNGYRMWDETHAVVRVLWSLLPDKFKYNHTGYSNVRLDEDYENRDYTGFTMECVRSQDIPLLLKEYFTCRVYVPYYSICRRFFDTMYGPNYDLSQELDRSILEFIWQLDVHFTSHGILKPETMFGVYTKGPERPRPDNKLRPGAVPTPIHAPQGTSPATPVLPLATSPVPTEPPLTRGEWAEFRHMLRAYQAVRRSRLFPFLKSVVRRLE